MKVNAGVDNRPVDPLASSDNVDNLASTKQPEPAVASTAPVANSASSATRLREQGVRSRESHDAQDVQRRITQSLACARPAQDRPLSRSEAALAQRIAKQFVKDQTKAEIIKAGMNRARVAPPPQPGARATLSNGDFLNNTRDFRTSVDRVRQLDAEVKRLEASGANPADIARVRAQLQTAENGLRTKYGYSAQTLPKPGAIWVDPQFMSKELSGGQVTATRFPVKPAVTTPPEPMDVLFRNGRTITLKDADGRDIVVRNANEYKQFVAMRRAELGMPVTDGEPTAVHLALEGGGGKGKRYNPAFASMYELGVVPTSVAGTSAGSIAAALIAAGASPKQTDEFAKDPQLSKLFDVGFDVDGGLFNGSAAFDLIDQKLREITGIKDRPVTFADLPIPLQLVAVKYNDDQLPPGQQDLSKYENRIFVFSQETTPNTPVALAVRASIAIPGVYDAVEMIDPVTGRQVELVDGGVLDNLPIGYNKNNLPTLAVNLMEINANHPTNKDNTAQPRPLQSGQINPGNAISAGLAALNMQRAGAGSARDYRERTSPGANTFVLNVPVWNLQNPKEGNTTLGFGYDNRLDPILDRQTRAVTNNFFKNFLDDIRRPGARGTNLKPLPATVSFDRTVRLDGQNYRALYTGGDRVNFIDGNGRQTQVSIGKVQIENWVLDDQAFGDLNVRLTMALRERLS